MLKLNDLRWAELEGTYSNGMNVAEQLTALMEGRLSSDSESHLWQELCHEYESSTAGYASVPHLVSLAETATPDRALFLLAISAHILASAQRKASRDIPVVLHSGLEGALARGIPVLQSLLGSSNLLAADAARIFAYTAAAFLKNPKLFFQIEGLDCASRCPSCGKDLHEGRNLEWKDHPVFPQ